MRKEECFAVGGPKLKVCIFHVRWRMRRVSLTVKGIVAQMAQPPGEWRG